MSFFGLLILLFIIFFVLRPLLKIWSAANSVRKQYNEMRDRASQSQQRSGASGNSGKRNSKVYSQQAGEYVEFEEIKGSRPQSSSQNDASTDPIDEEPLITDVPFEEIKD